MKKQFEMNSLQMRAELVPKSIDAAKKTVGIVWSTGSRVKRYSLALDDEFWEELSLDPLHVRLGRLNNGAPFLRLHESYDPKLECVLGVIVNGSAKIENGQGIAQVRFSSREDVEPVFNDIKEGILQHISVGYNVHRMVEAEQLADDGLRVFRAVDWEPLEVSLVPIGADDNAKVRSNEPSHICEIITLEEQMKKRAEAAAAPVETPVETPEKTEAPVEVPVEEPKEEPKPEEVKEEPKPVEVPVEEPKPEAKAEEARAEGVKMERARAEAICKIVLDAKLNREFADKLIKDNVSVENARKEVVEHLAVQDQKTKITTARTEVTGMDERQVRLEGCRDALLNRYDPKVYALSEQGRNFRNLRLIDMCREFVEASGVNTRLMSSDEVIKRAMSTSDMPSVFADVANKTLMQGYMNAPRTYTLIARHREVADFKNINTVQFGGAFALAKVNEGGEVKHGIVKDQGEQYKVDTYAKIISLTRQMIINDDLSVFTRIPQLAGAAAANMESDVVWELIAKTLGQTMKYDSKTLFHSDHDNYTSSGTVINVDNIGIGRELMMLQTGFDGKPLNLTPKYLFAPAKKLTIAEQYCAQLTATGDASKNNPFGGKLIPVGEARLDGYSTTSWYLMGDINNADIVETASLMGQAGPILETFTDSELLGVKFRITRDFGARVLDHRNVYKNAGA